MAFYVPIPIAMVAADALKLETSLIGSLQPSMNTRDNPRYCIRKTAPAKYGERRHGRSENSAHKPAVKRTDSKTASLGWTTLIPGRIE